MSQARTQDIIPESGLGPQNSQWRRWVERSITNLKLGFTAFKADIANSFKAVSSSMDLLSRQVRDMPVPNGFSINASGFLLEPDLGDPFYLMESSFTVPPNKTRMVITIMGNAFLVDTSSGGTGMYRAYIYLDTSEVSKTFGVNSKPVREPFGSYDRLVWSGIVADSRSGLTPGSDVDVALTLTTTAPSVFTYSNRCDLTATATFYN